MNLWTLQFHMQLITTAGRLESSTACLADLYRHIRDKLSNLLTSSCHDPVCLTFHTTGVLMEGRPSLVIDGPMQLHAMSKANSAACETVLAFVTIDWSFDQVC